MAVTVLFLPRLHEAQLLRASAILSKQNPHCTKIGIALVMTVGKAAVLLTIALKSRRLNVAPTAIAGVRRTVQRVVLLRDHAESVSNLRVLPQVSWTDARV